MNQITQRGGQLAGIRCCSSCRVRWIRANGIGNRLAIVDATQLVVADEGDLTIDSSKHGMVELDTAPTSPITAGTVYVSLWHANLLALNAERWINWKLANANPARWTTVNYV